jgi:hypothetical protein
MSSISIDQQVAVLIGDTLGLTGNYTVRRVPRWNIDGTEVKSVEQAAVLMGVTEDVAAHSIVDCDTGIDPELKQDAVSYLEVKVAKCVTGSDGRKIPVSKTRNKPRTRKVRKPLGTKGLTNPF